MDKRLKCKSQNHKSLRRKHNIFADIYPWARETKGEKNKWYYTNLKSFCTATEMIKMNRESSVWDNIFANETWDKGVISKVYKEFIHLNTRKSKNTIKKLAKDLNRQLI